MRLFSQAEPRGAGLKGSPFHLCTLATVCSLLVWGLLPIDQALQSGQVRCYGPERWSLDSSWLEYSPWIFGAHQHTQLAFRRETPITPPTCPNCVFPSRVCHKQESKAGKVSLVIPWFSIPSSWKPVCSAPYIFTPSPSISWLALSEAPMLS